MPLHPNLTGSDLHENKGVSTAADNTVAVASGGTTVWQKLTAVSLDASSLKNVNLITVAGLIPDISTNGSAAYITVPANCTLVSITTATQATASGTGPTISVYNFSTSTLLGTFAVTASGPGTPNAATIAGTFAGTQVIKISSGGGSTGTCPLNLTLTLSLT